MKIGNMLLRQNKGTAMGSPLGPIPADFFSVPFDLLARKKYETSYGMGFAHFHKFGLTRNIQMINSPSFEQKQIA